jgi:hypothetical protein
LEGVLLLINPYVKGLLFVLCDSVIIFIMVPVVSEDPEPVCVIPEGLNEVSFTCFSCLNAHRLILKFCPFIGYSALKSLAIQCVTEWRQHCLEEHILLLDQCYWDAVISVVNHGRSSSKWLDESSICFFW